MNIYRVELQWTDPKGCEHSSAHMVAAGTPHTAIYQAALGTSEPDATQLKAEIVLVHKDMSWKEYLKRKE